MVDRIIKSAYGLTFSRSFIFDRVLDIVPALCWSPNDIGLTRAHFVNGAKFASNRDACSYALKNNIPKKDIRYYFEWVNEVGDLEGIEREDFLRDTYWPKREQIANIMFDAALQANIHDTIPLFSQLTGSEFGELQFVELKTTNMARMYSGQPDTVLLDSINRNIIFIEIKIDQKTTRYTLNQHVKYIGLNALVSCNELFPNYRMHNILLAPNPDFSANTKGFDQIDSVVNSDRSVVFNYEGVNVQELKPAGHQSINSLVNTRIQSLTHNSETPDEDHTQFFDLKFVDWSQFFEMSSENNFKRNLEPLMPYLVD